MSGNNNNINNDDDDNSSISKANHIQIWRELV